MESTETGVIFTMGESVFLQLMKSATEISMTDITENIFFISVFSVAKLAVFV